MANTDFLPMRGPTHHFSPDPNLDRLFAMMLALGAEITKIDEKLDSVIRLLDRHSLVTTAELQAFEPTEKEQAERDAVRADFIGCLLAPFQAEADALAARAQAKTSAV